MKQPPKLLFTILTILWSVLILSTIIGLPIVVGILFMGAEYRIPATYYSLITSLISIPVYVYAIYTMQRKEKPKHALWIAFSPVAYYIFVTLLANIIFKP